jgi:hypothetical protein
MANTPIATSQPDEKQWKSVAASTTTPIANKKRKEVELIDSYYVVVGFEVNNPAAFVGNTHDLAEDYGHAFFYTVRNNIIQQRFSFGPNGPGKIGWFDSGGRNRGAPNNYDIGAILKDGYKNARPGTPDYGISERMKLFKITMTKKQAEKLEEKTIKLRKEIIGGKQKYTAYINDTCAETARDLLSKSGVDTPSGSGKVKHSGIVDFPIAYATNPYMWHKNFMAAGFKELVYEADQRPWLPPLGSQDPIFSASMSDK